MLRKHPGSGCTMATSGSTRRYDGTAVTMTALARALPRVRRLVRGAVELLPSPSRTPMTFGYLAVLLGTTGVLHAVGPDIAERVLAASSTDVAHLADAPLRVLGASALWLPSGHWLPYALSFTAVLAPLERAIGGRWTLAVFASGHVLATLATELPVAWAVHAQLLPGSAAHRLDVGVSYGFFASLGAALALLTPRLRALGLAGAAAYALVPFLARPDLTSTGHVLSLLVGLAWWPWLSGRGVAGSLRLPAVRRTEVGAPAATGTTASTPALP